MIISRGVLSSAEHSAAVWQQQKPLFPTINFSAEEEKTEIKNVDFSAEKCFCEVLVN